MPGTVHHLEPAAGALRPGDHEVFGSVHPMREVTRRLAFGGDWDDATRREVTALFDEVAAGWGTVDGLDDHDAVVDALDRGLGPDADAAEWCVELGSGTGLGTARLVDRFAVVVAAELSAEMLRRAPAHLGHRVQADAAAVPLRSATADVVVLRNMFLFPAELDRLLAPDGAIVWVNTNGEETPIHLPAEDVVAALPGTWDAVASRHGPGTWCVARRRTS